MVRLLHPRLSAATALHMLMLHAASVCTAGTGSQQSNSTNYKAHCHCRCMQGIHGSLLLLLLLLLHCRQRSA
jgi:hypothetical protein